MFWLNAFGGRALRSSQSINWIEPFKNKPRSGGLVPFMLLRKALQFVAFKNVPNTQRGGASSA